VILHLSSSSSSTTILLKIMTRTTLIVCVAGIVVTPFLSAVHGFVSVVHSSTTPNAAVLPGAASDNCNETKNQKIQWNDMAEQTLQTAGATLIAMAVTTAPVWAADSFAKTNISGMDFSGQDLSGKDFTGVVARKTNFHNCNLQGSTFNKAVLENTDFSGANVRQATFVDATLDGASFKDAVAEKATFSASILDIGDLENVDLTDSLWPSKCFHMGHAIRRKGVFVRTWANMLNISFPPRFPLRR
jgi:branched-subunit amino acid transport protein